MYEYHIIIEKRKLIVIDIERRRLEVTEAFEGKSWALAHIFLHSIEKWNEIRR